MVRLGAWLFDLIDFPDPRPATGNFDTMVLHNPNNWHWVNKDASAWAKQWFTDNLAQVEAENGDVKVRISKVQSMDGDCDVSQRKGKVITIFDVKLVLEYTGRTTVVEAHNRPRADSAVGSAPEAEEVSGTITVPEIAHDTEADEYVVRLHHTMHVRRSKTTRN